MTVENPDHHGTIDSFCLSMSLSDARLIFRIGSRKLEGPQALAAMRQMAVALSANLNICFYHPASRPLS